MSSFVALKHEGGAVGGQLSLFPEKMSEQFSSFRSDNDSLDERDPQQIEAAIEALIGHKKTHDSSYGMLADRKSMNGLKANGVSRDESRRRTQFFEEQFQYKDNSFGSARERIEKDSPVIAELRTNVIVKDEFTLVTDMSYHLSTRYSRSESSIMINVDHSACLLLAGSFEPAYILTISALPSQLQPTTNKRNAALIQSFMADILSVPPERGILRFKPIPEENLATNGATVLGEMERVEKQRAEDDKNSSVKQAFQRDSRKSLASKKSALRATPEPGSPRTTTSKHLSAASPPLPNYPSPTPPALFEGSTENKRKSLIADRRKSMSGILQGQKNVTPGLTATPMPVPMPRAPPIPQEKAKVQKRKSFLSVFRK
ncbi:hypothetical protein MBLNU459_g3686t1 [Dothideomycetes sp. NU459]